MKCPKCGNPMKLKLNGNRQNEWTCYLCGIFIKEFVERDVKSESLKEVVKPEGEQVRS